MLNTITTRRYSTYWRTHAAVFWFTCDNTYVTCESRDTQRWQGPVEWEAEQRKSVSFALCVASPRCRRCVAALRWPEVAYRKLRSLMSRYIHHQLTLLHWSSQLFGGTPCLAAVGEGVIDCMKRRLYLCTGLVKLNPHRNPAPKINRTFNELHCSANISLLIINHLKWESTRSIRWFTWAQ